MRTRRWPMDGKVSGQGVQGASYRPGEKQERSAETVESGACGKGTPCLRHPGLVVCPFWNLDENRFTAILRCFPQGDVRHTTVISSGGLFRNVSHETRN